MRALLKFIALGVTAALAACSVHGVTFTPDDAQGCTVESDCSNPACTGAPVCQPRCGNGKLDPGEQCDDGNTVNGDACEADCTLPVCGNGILDPGEQCDDGNILENDGCDPNCTFPGCGNGFVDPGEQCDDANQVNGDGCDNNCTVTACGNGIVDPGEQCDDANQVNGDGCDNNCTVTACGNGIVDPGEQCDDGNQINGDGCEANCTLPVCGNRILDPGEECDGLLGLQPCSQSCRQERCGNGIVDLDPANGINEECDDGLNNGKLGDTCSVTCHIVACGNGVVEQGEECDDGLNNNDNKRCTASCRLNVCGDGHLLIGVEQCDDGNNRDSDGCEANCTLPVCGNGILDPGEQCDDGNTINGDFCDNNCTLPVCGNGILDPGEQCDDGNLVNNDGCDNTCTLSVLSYIKASNTGSPDEFGWSVALSADGSTLAVGAPTEASAATGINGNQADNSAASAGAVYVFTRSGPTWIQQAYIKASNAGAGDLFGWSVALSADGSTLAVGAIEEASAATGINGNQADNSAANAGASYVFTRSGTTWTQQAYVKASNTGAGDIFGWSVALSADGATLAVGALEEASAATGINGNQADNSLQLAGAVYVFTRSGSTWTQQAYIKASNTGLDDEFGSSVALSADGATLAVGARLESSAATGINGNQADNSAQFAGAVYVFTRSGTTWSQQAYVKASNTGASDEFGQSVALSADGSTLAVGAFEEASAATGINGNQADNSASAAGAAYVFTRSGTAWSQQAYVKASNTGANDEFGTSVALSRDGATLAVGAPGEASAATGIGGNQADNSASFAGAAYIFARSGTTWSQTLYVKASNTGADDEFGESVALAFDGTLAVGAFLEDSAATGVGGNQADNSASTAGAVYVVQ